MSAFFFANRHKYATSRHQHKTDDDGPEEEELDDMNNDDNTRDMIAYEQLARDPAQHVEMAQQQRLLYCL